MSTDPITFQGADELIEEHGPRFAREGVVGVGVAERGGEIRFVVAVETEEMRDRLEYEYRGETVGGYPVYVEQRELVRLTGDATDLPRGGAACIERHGIVRELIERPGYLILAGLLAIACVVVIAL